MVLVLTVVVVSAASDVAVVLASPCSLKVVFTAVVGSLSLVSICLASWVVVTVSVVDNRSNDSFVVVGSVAVLSNDGEEEKKILRYE